MLDGFSSAEIETGEARIFLRSRGSGPAILLLHGFPQTHVMWRSVAPLLTCDHTVICADLRGYGRSSCPASATSPCCWYTTRPSTTPPTAPPTSTPGSRLSGS